jgi:hypothetical protein
VEQVDAKKNSMSPDEAVRLARSVRHLYVARGKKVVHIDMEAEASSDAELKKLIVGPSGNLRAPTARSGDRMFVGFNPEEFAAGLWGK